MKERTALSTISTSKGPEFFDPNSVTPLHKSRKFAFPKDESVRDESSLCGRSEAELRSAGIENTVVSIEEDVTVDILVAASDTLEGAKAGLAGRISGAEVQVFGGNGGIAPAANLEAKSWEIGAARKDVAALSVIKFGSTDGGVVLGDLSIAHEDQGGTGV